jgi:hypothetical protein
MRTVRLIWIPLCILETYRTKQVRLLMNKEQKFRLRTSVQQWSREFHAPFIRPIYKALLDYFETHHSGVNWKQAIPQARANFKTAKRWGPLTSHQRSVRLYVKGLNVELSCAKAAWALIFPDYLLVTYPTFPVGRAGKLADEWSHSCNPFYWQPSHLWLT